MDGHRFDRLTLLLGQARNRRHAGGLLLAAALGTLLEHAPPASARKRKHKRHHKHKTCKPACAGQLTCVGRTCVCAQSTACGVDCVDTDTNHDHCGACNAPCAAGESCSGGACSAPDDLYCDFDIDRGERSGANHLKCNQAAHRCECFQIALLGLAYGICDRFPDGGGTCGRCCAGAVPLGQDCTSDGTGDLVCVDDTLTGCNCPPSAPEACPFEQCSIDRDSDPRRCGADCQDCTRNGPCNCCGGVCQCGCQPGFSDCNFVPCGSDCTPCGEDAPLCCAGDPSYCTNEPSCP